LIVGAALLAGCGEAEPQSKAEFVDKADQICDSLVVEQRRALKDMAHSYTTSADNLADAIDEYRDVLAVRLERIKDLGRPNEPPLAYEASLRRYVRQLETAATGEENGVANPAPVMRVLAAERSKVLGEAGDYGLDRCQALDDKPLPMLAQPPPQAAGDAP
jgi:hypothetical protein